jgi:hypothetical protein
MTHSATLLGGVPENLRLGAFDTSEDLKEKNKKNLLPTCDREASREEGTHLLDEGCAFLLPCQLTIPSLLLHLLPLHQQLCLPLGLALHP